MKRKDNIRGYKLPLDQAAIITSLAYQKKDKLRASIFIAGEFAFGINVVTIEYFRLRKGDEISQTMLEELQEFDEHISAKRTASKFLGTRRRSEREVRDKLRMNEYTADTISKVVEELTTANLINDAEFCEAFIHDKLLTKSASKRELQSLLFKKGISKEVALEALSELVDQDDEGERAIAAAEKKWATLLRRESDARKRNQKLYAFLASRGFDRESIKKAIASVSEEVIEEEA